MGAGCLDYGALSNDDAGRPGDATGVDLARLGDAAVDGGPSDGATPDGGPFTNISFVESSVASGSDTAVVLPAPTGSMPGDIVVMGVRRASTAAVTSTPACLHGAADMATSDIRMVWCAHLVASTGEVGSYRFVFKDVGAFTAIALTYRHTSTALIGAVATYGTGDSQDVTAEPGNVVVPVLAYETIEANDPSWTAPDGFVLRGQTSGIDVFDGPVGSVGHIDFPFSFASTDDRGAMLTAFITLYE